jgi:multidrug transporter EmrE-like cation transporter
VNFLSEHFYILFTIASAVASQLIIKWKMSSFDLSHLPTVGEKFLFAITMLLNPYIMASIFLTLLSGLSWMIAMTKFDISYAYPYTALGFILILLFSVFLFHEPFNWYKFLSVILIVAGIFAGSKGYE